MLARGNVGSVMLAYSNRWWRKPIVITWQPTDRIPYIMQHHFWKLWCWFCLQKTNNGLISITYFMLQHHNAFKRASGSWPPKSSGVIENSKCPFDWPNILLAHHLWICGTWKHNSIPFTAVHVALCQIDTAYGYCKDEFSIHSAPLAHPGYFKFSITQHVLHDSFVKFIEL